MYKVEASDSRTLLLYTSNKASKPIPATDIVSNEHSDKAYASEKENGCHRVARMSLQRVVVNNSRKQQP